MYAIRSYYADGLVPAIDRDLHDFAVRIQRPHVDLELTRLVRSEREPSLIVRDGGPLLVEPGRDDRLQRSETPVPDDRDIAPRARLSYNFV